MGDPRSDFFEIGKPLDAVVYRASDPILSSNESRYLLPRILFNGDRSAVFGTIVNGKWIVKNGFHHEDEVTRTAFKEVLDSLSL